MPFNSRRPEPYDAKKETQRRREQRQDNNDLKKTLIYPTDIDGEDFYPEAIKFTVYQRKGASLEKIVGTLGKIGSKIVDASMSKEKIEEEITAADNQFIVLHGRMQGEDDEIVRGNYNNEMSELAMRSHRLKGLMKDFDKNNDSIFDVMKNSKQEWGTVYNEITSGLHQHTMLDLQGKEKTSQLGEIYLNMPNEITFTDEANWEGTDLGAIGGIIKKEGSQAVKSGLFSNFANIVGGGTGALASKVMNMAGGAPVGAVLGMLGGTGLQKSLESGASQIANPYKEMTFSGIGFRNFSFNFVFRARNEKEVNEIQEIIKTFRYYSKPIYTHGKSGFFTYPEEFHIEFLTKCPGLPKHTAPGVWETNSYIPQIKMCVCKSVATNFAAQNAWRSLENGAPVEVSLALAFEETELVTGEDVVGKTAVGRFKGTKGTF